MRLRVTIFISSFLCFFSTHGQRKLNGRIVNQFMEIGVGIAIFDSDSTEIGMSDLNGEFTIKLPIENIKLTFAGIGYEQETITIPKECDEAEIILFLASSYDFILPKKVDRLRKKEFEKLPKLHFQAFQKGLFKTEKSCALRRFEPNFKDL